jgi:hypothetical protein
MSKRTLFACVVFAGFLALVQVLSAATPSLTGSWQFTLTATAPPTPPVVPIPGLATFTSDGSVIETDGSEFALTASATAAPAKTSTPGHGIWQMANTPETLYVQYISLVLDTDGALYARRVTTMFLTMNAAGNMFSGTYTTDQVTGSVTTLLSSGTVTGQLIPHVALP